MTLPFLSPVVVQSVASAASALAEWQRAMDSLAVEVSKLASLAAQGDRAAAARASAVESLLLLAARAGTAYAATKATVPSDVQQRWVSILTRAQAALAAAKSLAQRTSPSASLAPLPSASPATVPDPRDGLRIPGTRIVLPWAALLGVALVVGVGIYMRNSSRRKS